MVSISKVRQWATDLPETQRAVLAAHLLRTLPSVLHDEDEGLAEALRRDADMERHPSKSLTLPKLDRMIKIRRA